MKIQKAKAEAVLFSTHVTDSTTVSYSSLLLALVALFVVSLLWSRIIDLNMFMKLYEAKLNLCHGLTSV